MDVPSDQPARLHASFWNNRTLATIRAAIFGAMLSTEGATCCLHAENSDVYSPVVSFQFREGLGKADGPTSTNSQVVSYQLCEELGGREGIEYAISPVVSFQYTDWPGDENLAFATSSNVSYYFPGAPIILEQPRPAFAVENSTVSLSVVADAGPQVTYRWLCNGAEIAGANSATLILHDAQLSNQGRYSVWVSNSYGTRKSISVPILVYAHVAAPRELPTSISTTAALPPSLTAAPTDASTSHLTVLHSGSLGHADRGKMTVVMTHGWNSSPDTWAIEMAEAIRDTGADANLLVWDWHTNANERTAGLAASHAFSEGSALGRALIQELGPAYEKEIHFIGHSLGALVNCAAADYIHNDKREADSAMSSAVKFSPMRTQMTLLDEAEMVSVEKTAALLWKMGQMDDYAEWKNGLIVGLALRATSLTSKVLPDHFAWADNYMSSVGLPQAGAVNVLLPRVWLAGNVFPGWGAGWYYGHGYSYQWYTDTIRAPGEGLMGYRWSFENKTLVPGGMCSGVPELGSLFIQDPLSLSGLDVLPASSPGEFAQGVLYANREVVDAYYTRVESMEAQYIGAVQYAGDLALEAVEMLNPPHGEPVYSATSGSTAVYFKPMNLEDPVYAEQSLQMRIKASAPSARITVSEVRTMSDTLPPQTAYAILSVHVPIECIGLSFEYSINGAAADEFMTMGIGDTKQFQMEAKFIRGAEWDRTPVIGVSNYRNQDIQLAFALNRAVGTPVGTLSIRDIRFYLPSKPRLTVGATADEIVLTWPISAIDWTLESTTNLADPQSWLPVAAPVEDTSYAHTVRVPASGAGRLFFRLKK